MWEEHHVNHIKWVCGQLKIGGEDKCDLPWFWFNDVSLQVMRLKSALKARSQKQHCQQWVPKGLRVESHGSEKWKQGQGRLCCGQLWLRVHHRGGQGGNFPSNLSTFSSHLAQVWMKEGEVLLLLSKTNGDWWQVSILSLGLVFSVQQLDSNFNMSTARSTTV